MVTVEDPIEMLHSDRRSIINQREVGTDTGSFADALRRVLRQDPDVIMIGEIRDLVTMETALSAAETGHLVLSTMHTLDATETVNRAIGFFPLHQQQPVRAMLAGTLRGIISQRLVRTADGEGRVPAVEVLVTTGRARDMILNPDETGRITEIIREGDYYGMQTFDQALLAHVQAGRVKAEDALRAANRPQDLRLMLAQVAVPVPAQPMQPPPRRAAGAPALLGPAPAPPCRRLSRLRSRRPARRPQGGFSLIEVLVSIMVLAIVAGGLAAGLTATSAALPGARRPTPSPTSSPRARSRWCAGWATTTSEPWAATRPGLWWPTGT